MRCLQNTLFTGIGVSEVLEHGTIQTTQRVDFAKEHTEGRERKSSTVSNREAPMRKNLCIPNRRPHTNAGKSCFGCCRCECLWREQMDVPRRFKPTPETPEMFMGETAHVRGNHHEQTARFEEAPTLLQQPNGVVRMLYDVI